MNEVNDIGVGEEGEETKDIENEGLIHIYITENETGTNQDALKKVIKELPYDIDYKEG